MTIIKIAIRKLDRDLPNGGTVGRARSRAVGMSGTWFVLQESDNWQGVCKSSNRNCCGVSYQLYCQVVRCMIVN